MHRTKVRIVEDALDANNTIAQANRADFDRAGVTVVNFMSAPGAGKTSLLERVVGDVPGVRVGVLEGDVQGSMDADRLASLHVPVTQLNTDPSFGGECHLDANMVRSALEALPLEEIDMLVIENVGNLVCPAEFKVGEDVRVMVSSVTEGEDKPLKYPLMFRTCDLVLVNKIDLLAHLDYDLDRFLYNIDQVHPGADAAARQRPHRGGHRGVARLAGRASPLARARGRRLDGHSRPPPTVRCLRISTRLLARRTEANARFFAEEAERLARLCHRMAERFARGGRLIALGASAGGALGRASRRGRVRPSRDRRQARAARDRPDAERAASWRRQLDLLAREDDIAIAFVARTTMRTRSPARRRSPAGVDA